MTPYLIAIAFVTGVLVGWWWNRRSGRDVLEAAKASASLAAAYSNQGQAFFTGAGQIMATLEQTQKEVARFANESKAAARALDTMDRNQAVILNALVRVGVIRTGGGVKGRDGEGGEGAPGSEFS